jgi:hypothetical protein
MPTKAGFHDTPALVPRIQAGVLSPQTTRRTRVGCGRAARARHTTQCGRRGQGEHHLAPKPNSIGCLVQCPPSRPPTHQHSRRRVHHQTSDGVNADATPRVGPPPSAGIFVPSPSLLYRPFLPVFHHPLLSSCTSTILAGGRHQRTHSPARFASNLRYDPVVTPSSCPAVTRRTGSRSTANELSRPRALPCLVLAATQDTLLPPLAPPK